MFKIKFNTFGMTRPLVFSGPSGSGKTTFLNLLTKKYPDRFSYSVGFTTRHPREGEINGVHYNFVTKEKFQEMIANNELLEWSSYCSNCYGQAKKSVQELIDKGIVPILAIDLNGVLSVKTFGSSLNPKYIFIQTPNLESLQERLASRGTESMDIINKRLSEAERELNYAHSTPDAYDLILINDNIEESFKRFEEFALAD